MCWGGGGGGVVFFRDIKKKAEGGGGGGGGGGRGQNVSQNPLYGVQHIHINLTLVHSTFHCYADADQN